MAADGKYSTIRVYRDHEMSRVMSSSNRINLLHEKILNATLNVSMDFIQQNDGPPPSPFCFFIMGSAGRSEQGVWSDQDHGIVYKEGDEETKEYFLRLGREIADGLLQTGYKKCDGNVMASNPFWCKSLTEWQEQIDSWISSSSWEAIRHLLTFLDGRPFVGDASLFNHLKQSVYETIHQEHLLNRILENTMHVKKSIGVLGHFLVETHGPYTGLLNIKESGLFPYVNAARLLAIRSRIMETSTFQRLQQIPDSILPVKDSEKFCHQFRQLQNYRLTYGVHTDYESGHYIEIRKLSKNQKKELKEILKDGSQLFTYAKKFIKKEDQNGNE